MQSKLPFIRMIFQSTLFLVFAFAALVFLQLATMQTGAYVSGFEGLIILEGITTIAVSNLWYKSQVMWIYLMPYGVFVMIFTLVAWQRRYPTEIPMWVQLLQSWTYVVLLLTVFFMPLWEILNQRGIYYALNWLHIDMLLQFAFGIFMWLILLTRVLHISILFSTSLIIPPSKTIIPKQIMIQLPFLWYIPLLILIGIIYLLSNFIIPEAYMYFLGGMVFILLVNTGLISRYSVIVK